MSTLVVSIKTNKDHTEYKKSSQPHMNLIKIANLIEGLNSGAHLGTVQIAGSTSDPMAASGSIAITHANLTADDTVTIGGVTITAKASGATAGIQFNIGANATADAVNLAAAINANTTLSKHLTASAATGTVTLTANLKGSIGNLIVMSTSDATAFALTQMANGAGGPEGAAVTIGR